jgi:hypothetical protein
VGLSPSLKNNKWHLARYWIADFKPAESLPRGNYKTNLATKTF